MVLVTALEDQDSRVRGIEAGADDFLSKPVRREELIARVKTLRRLHETRKELEGRRLAAEVQHKEAIRKAFARYISPRLAERVLRDSARGERRVPQPFATAPPWWRCSPTCAASRACPKRCRCRASCRC